MNWFTDMKIGVKLIGGFLLVAIIAAIIGVMGLRAVDQLHSLAARMYDVELVGLRHATDAKAAVLMAGRTARSALLAPTAAERDQQLEALKQYLSAADTELKTLDTLLVTQEGKTFVRNTHDALRAYEGGIKKMIGVLVAEPPGQAVKANEILTHEIHLTGNKLEDLMDGLVQGKQNNAKQAAVQTNGIYDFIFAVMISLTAGGALLALGLGVLITRGLTRQLGGEPKEVAGVAHAIADGDLTTAIDTAKARDGSVIHAMSRMQASLRQVVGSVRESSDSIATGSHQIALGNADLSQRTEEQAANITETAAAMEQLASTVKSNAEVSEQAVTLATTASTVASQGGHAVNNVVETMDGIAQASRKIVDIIAVIDGIAFQTNILALNASVEAARAGEEGRGFAVVASEVRNLAQKSAAAAKEIKTLIDDSASRVEAGSQMADAAGATMLDIVNQVKRVTDLINEIHSATTEQASGLEQINNAVTQLSDVTQQNAALVEESAAAAESLDAQAEQLVAAVGAFKLGQRRAGRPENASALNANRASAPTVRQQASGPAMHRLGSVAAASRLRSPLVETPLAAKNDEWESF
ncbi:methyl-accepting chemotaxis protein [Eoetvoesiella caeni]|uniref:Methyl-accepting chemotaxis protein n=1 Tax=Eoetvoesiella caeni TaxID=645616 RepID=A0A366HGM5_9BURK|nr:methyl-accepting chemotaxis protein [Eoetvoesiella caeni]MCI2808806.1 methyl-accepting chemotaxis protein [Eoetvoesiella caeni]NYT55346.1 MCP four helix bundle domain-containing protein [Eoetvoesiella caeni]RBP40672.1 methyl-accepting chemotaxis protein [Eoetvoesiella caeni]